MRPFDLAFNTVQNQIEKALERFEAVEYGYITDIMDDGIHAEIQLSNDRIRTVCVIASFCTKGLSIETEAGVGDHVLILFPRKYHKDMWKAQEPIISEYSCGYDLLSGIAVPLNLFGKASSKSVLHIMQDGSASLELDSNASLEAKIGGAALKLTDKTINYTNGSGTIEMDASGKTTINGHLEVLP